MKIKSWKCLAAAGCAVALLITRVPVQALPEDGGDTDIWTGFASCESGSEGFRQAGGDGGHAFGLFQFDDRYDLFPFLGVCIETDPGKYGMFSDIYTRYIGTGKSIAANSADLNQLIQAWHDAYDQDPEEFGRLQLDRFVEIYYPPCVEYCNAKGIDIQSDEFSPVIRGTLMSISIWAGPDGARKVINRLNSGMTELEMLDVCYSDFTAELKGASSRYIASFRERWTRTQKTLASQAYTKWAAGNSIPTTSSETLLGIAGALGGAGVAYGIDGGTYVDYIREWINQYPELAQEFRSSGGWNTENREWCMTIRNAGDFYELYGIVGCGQTLDLSIGTTGGFAVRDDGVEINAELYEIPDNGGSMPIPYFSQGSGAPWAGLQFGGGNIGSSGCSITSLAMVVSYLTAGTDKEGWVYPSDIRAMIAAKNGGNHNAFYVSGQGASHDIMPSVAGYYGLTCGAISSSSIVAALQRGQPVIMSCAPGEFTKKGHYIVLTGLTADGLITVNDPAHPSKSYKAYPPSYIASQGKGWWAFSN